MKTRWMQWSLAVLLTGVFLGSTGCSQALVGTWKTDPVPKDLSYLVQATFKADGNFEATAKQDAETTTPMKGTYDFNGFKLTLKQAGKPEQVYDAAYIMGGKLDLKQGAKKYRMKKQ